MCRLGCSSGSYCLVMKACCQYWNTCLPLAASSFGRELLCDPVLELLSLVATFLGRGKDEPLEKDQDTLLAMYGLVFQALSDQVILVASTLTVPLYLTWKESLVLVWQARWGLAYQTSLVRAVYPHILDITIISD